jgi:hypothetical protein
MKYILIVLFATLAIPSFSQEKDKDVMIKKIFTILQQKDEAGFVKLFPDAAVMKEFILKQIGKDKVGEDTLSDEYKTMLADITESSLQKEFGEMFREIIEKGEKKGVVWAKTNFVSYTADSALDEESGMARLEGKVYFNIGKMEYFLKYDEIIRFENLGWYGVSIDRIDEKSKENEPEEKIDWSIADSAAVMMVDTAMKMPESERKIPAKKGVIKPKTTIKAPVKSKSSASARKPD